MLCSDAVISVIRQDVGLLSWECAGVCVGGGASGRGGPFMLLTRKPKLREAKEAEARKAQRSSSLPPGPVAANQVVIGNCSDGTIALVRPKWEGQGNRGSVCPGFWGLT